MNLTLYKQMMKVNIKGMLNYALGSAFYMILMVWVYPSIAENTKTFDELVKSMPAGLTKAFGFESGFGSFESYISGEYYGVLLPLIVTIFCVMLPTQLVAKLVDHGSMAYLLATPTTRGKIAFTQALVLITGIVLIMALTTISGFTGFYLFIEDASAFHTARFLQLNIGAFLLFFAVGGISFLISSLSNDEKKSLGISGAIAIGFFSLDLVGKISEKIDWLRNMTIYSLYAPSDIVSGTAKLGPSLALLAAIGALAFFAGIYAFKKRDLPL
ncbi:ABC transporter permease subunit [Neobacillus sp. YIM B06451]|uniref:ABC transporter permease subunit n=1 Tax=Neobacillus sp. YIM B06451 TaxID=3070994 RepID=UPI00292CBCE9|nr:ABC transporter permease subunit [Neobacillus sp. YIM B06451]